MNIRGPQWTLVIFAKPAHVAGPMAFGGAR
jgi:hypothetical protein